MYNQIPTDIYSFHLQKLLGDKKFLSFPYEPLILGHVMFNISEITLTLFMKDYAAFLAHKDKWQGKGNAIETIHLGLRAISNFMSFWDHIGYGLNAVFELNMTEREVTFRKAIEILKKGKDAGLVEICEKMMAVYSKQKEVKEDYRNPFAHRIHEAFVKRHGNDTEANKLVKLSESLDRCYKGVLETFYLYFKLMKKYSHPKNIGSFPRK